ncbi:glutamate synthase-related protein [Candidatus Saccharibacteria bacterium]|nr:glutamate synthase-related protein [Candidatus Saccharibacteria bacterium]
MIYRCKMCGQNYDESVESTDFSDLPDDWVCPVCGAPKSLFEPIAEETVGPKSHEAPNASLEDNMAYIQTIAATGESVIEPSGTKINVTNWSDILLIGGQLNRKPLESPTEVKTETVIGRLAKKPLVLSCPIIVSHMSHGALTGEQKTAIARGANAVGVGIGSGEGGIYEGEIAENSRYIFEYVPSKYSATDKNLKRAGAIEIKIGQSAKPGLGGHLPGAKVTEEIAKIRGKKAGEDIIAPPAFTDINSPEDLKGLVDELRQKSDGRPIGIKLAANDVEADLAWVKIAQPDFVTIDGRGGGTGAAPKIWRDAAGIPTVYALARARKFLDENKLAIDLIATGGLRISSDFAKALSMGADAVAVATSVLTALATDSDLADAKKVENYLGISNQELKTMTGAMGHRDVRELDLQNLVTTNHDIADYTDIPHV